MLGKTDLGEFILHNQDKMGEGLKGMLKDIEHKTKANQYVLFWLVSERTSMALYKLKSVRYSTKKEKLRIQNGRSDVVLELNSGFMNFRQLLNLVADEVLLWSHLRFAIRIEYIDQQLSYYIETPMDIGDSLIAQVVVGRRWIDVIVVE